MRSCLLYIALLLVNHSHAQKIEKYFDWQWKECDVSNARNARQAFKTDSGWRCIDYFVSGAVVQMVGLYRDEALKISNGNFSYFFASGNFKSTGRYEDNKKVGLWLSYHHNGMLQDSTVYSVGYAAGISMGWYSNGYVSDSVVHGYNGTDVFVNWYDDGAASATGRMVNGKLHGTCQYFHNNGMLAALEKYDNGKILSRTYYDENGIAEKDTASRDREAAFKGGTNGWKKFILKNLYFPDQQFKLTNADAVVVIVTATIDESGKVTDAFVELPFHPKFDEIALSVFKTSPNWIPAISHNRYVKAYVRQPIVFSQ